MGRLTLRPNDPSYWLDKLIMPHPSTTPDGYRFLFTHSDPVGRHITGESGGRTVINDRGDAYTEGGKPTNWTNFYNEYDVYEKCEPPPPKESQIGQGLVVTSSLIKNGYKIPEMYTDIITEKVPSAYCGLMRFVCRYLEDGRTIKIENLDSFYDKMIVVNYYVKY